MHQAQIDVVELTGRRRDGVKILAVASLVGRRDQRQQCLRGGIEARGGNLIPAEWLPRPRVEDRATKAGQIAAAFGECRHGGIGIKWVARVVGGVVEKEERSRV